MAQKMLLLFASLQEKVGDKNCIESGRFMLLDNANPIPRIMKESRCECFRGCRVALHGHPFSNHGFVPWLFIMLPTQVLTLESSNHMVFHIE